MGCVFWNLGDGCRDWMPEAGLAAISVSLLNNKKPTSSDTQDAKEDKNSKATARR